MHSRAASPPPPLRATQLLDQLRERVRYRHYSLSTERSYLYWVRVFVRRRGMRQPKGMGAPEVEAFLHWLVNQHGASVSTHRQALSALVRLYTHVLYRWMTVLSPLDDDLLVLSLQAIRQLD